MRGVPTYPEPPDVDLELYLPTYSEPLALYGSRAGALAGCEAAPQEIWGGKFGFKIGRFSA